ncbi:MAG: AAA family ATPase, partial [Dehalococcoidia bacterium]
MSEYPVPPPFVGRERELSLLLGYLMATQHGQGGVVCLAGEPGIGKTRLVTELADRARAQGTCVLLGRASPATGVPAYLPFKEALGPYVRECPPALLRSQVGHDLAQIALLLPALHERLPGLTTRPSIAPDHERYQLLASTSDFILRIARSASRGAILLLDDLHAADPPTLALLQHLVGKLGAAPLLIVGTYRTADIEQPRPLREVLAELSRHELSGHLLLRPLSPDAVVAMTTGMTGAAVAPSVGEMIHQQSGGNPFFVREIVRHLQSEAHDWTDARIVSRDWGIPDGVRFVIGKRLAALPSVVQPLLRAGAVLGDGCAQDVLMAVSGLDGEPFLDALEGALGADIVREDVDGYHFSHALIREAVYRELPLARRQRLHLRAAETIERLHAPYLHHEIGRIASHYRLAGPVADPVKTLETAQRAGAAAAAICAWEEAIVHWQAAADLLDKLDPDVVPGALTRRCDLLLDLGRMHGYAGNGQEARETYRLAAMAARQLGAPDRLAWAAIGYGDVYMTGSAVDEYLVDLLEAALDGLGRKDSPVRARALASLAMALRYAPDARHRATLVRTAVAMARRTGDWSTLTVALTALHVADWEPGNLTERLDAATEAVRLAEASGDRVLAYWGHHWRAIDLLEMGDVAALDRELAAHRRLAEELRTPTYAWNSLRLRATRAIMTGAFELGEQFAGEAFEIGKRVDPVDAHAMYITQLWNIRLWQGRLEELVVDWEHYCTYYDTIPAWQARLAWLYAELGRETEARQVIERLAAHDGAAVPREMHWLSAMTFLAEACSRTGDVAHAATLYELLKPYADYNVRSGGYPVSLACFGSASRPLGLLAATLGRWDAAASHFDDAITMNTRMQAWPWVAQTQHAYAAMLLSRRARGDLLRARALLEQAIARYDELGMISFASRARRLRADADRVHSGASRAPYPDHLTPREVEVLRLIVDGCSNRQI